MGIRLLNLNSYEVVDAENATLRIRPKKTNGIQPPDLFFRGIKKNGKQAVTHADIINGTAEWNPSVIIDVTGTPQEYTDLVDWWVDSARDDGSYGKSINERFEILGDVLGTVLAAKAWLTETAAYTVNSDGEYIKRGKGEINRFITGWLTREKKRVVAKRR